MAAAAALLLLQQEPELSHHGTEMLRLVKAAGFNFFRFLQLLVKERKPRELEHLHHCNYNKARMKKR